ncbi:hypothetical protein LCGC14_1277490 [marine sediment metagenome]|uniref:Uncharacterized protein n=1 Tax=marine sediment metagenome TaxID=412755 RepID=A0A0F9NZA6_9ZZZZ
MPKAKNPPFEQSFVPDNSTSWFEYHRDTPERINERVEAAATLIASRLVVTDADILLNSADLTDFVEGVADEIDVASDGSGGVTIGIVNPLIVSKGGTGAASLTNHGLLAGSGTSPVAALAAATNGQLPIGKAGFDPVMAAILGTANQISVALGAGSITLALAAAAVSGVSRARQYFHAGF